MEFEEENRHFVPRGNGIFVKVPPAHQGVADALRAAFVPIENRLPNEMEDLLRQLR